MQVSGSTDTVVDRSRPSNPDQDGKSKDENLDFVRDVHVKYPLLIVLVPVKVADHLDQTWYSDKRQIAYCQQEDVLDADPTSFSP